MLAAALLVTALQSPAADSLRVLAQAGTEANLVVETRTRPHLVRDAVSEALRRAVRLPDSTDAELATARRIAAAYAVAWSDSFLVREVGRFAAWTTPQRSVKVWTDSVRRAGNVALGRDGGDAAIVVWRRALARAGTLRDTATMAALLGNIGTAHLDGRRLDSATVQCSRARSLARAVGDMRVEANALVCQAEVSAERGEIASASSRHTQALALHERVGDARGVAADHNNIGLLAQEIGDLKEARRRFEAALASNTDGRREDLAAINLVNLAGLALLDGDFSKARTLYRDALAKWRHLEQWAETAEALRGLAQLEQRRGDYPAARAALSEAVAVLERTGSTADALDVRRDLAMTMAAIGDLQGALEALRRVHATADSIDAPADVRAGIALARADLAFLLNASADAVRLYTVAEGLYRQAADRGGEAEAQHGHAIALLEADDVRGAESLLRAALRAQTAVSAERGAALTRMSLGRVLRERGDTAEARRQLVRASATLARLGDRVAVAAALEERAALAAATAMPAAADSLYRAGLAQLEGRVAPEVAWRLRAGLAGVRRARGDFDAAARELRAALVEIERPGRSLSLAERRSAYLADKWDVYALLALTEHDRGRASAAFEASERLRAREMLELLGRGRVASPGATASNAELVEREQDLRRRIAELTHQMEGPSGSAVLRGGNNVASAGSRDALGAAQSAYAELLLEMQERSPRHAELIARKSATWRDVAAKLRADEALIEYLLSDSTSIAFVVTRDTLHVVELAVRRRELTRLVEFARGTVDVAPAGREEELWRGGLRRLHEYLVSPIDETTLLRDKTRLVIVPHGELHYVPFAALLSRDSGDRFLVQRFEIAVTPSASVWLALGERDGRPTAGTLAMAPIPDRLRGAQREVAAVERLDGRGASVLSGQAASEAAFRRDAPSRRVLYLATYGILNKQNPLFSFIELSPGGGEDGRLEVHEVFGLSLAAELVVLSACQTGLASGALADVPAGDDWVGLVRAFLHAGAANVVATLWPVDDLSSAALMERFYESFAEGTEPASALARAQRAMLATPTTAHPFYWAGFVAVRGDGGRPGSQRGGRG